jgi:hypothetical protein
MAQTDALGAESARNELANAQTHFRRTRGKGMDVVIRSDGIGGSYLYNEGSVRDLAGVRGLRAPRFTAGGAMEAEPFICTAPARSAGVARLACQREFRFSSLLLTWTA